MNDALGNISSHCISHVLLHVLFSTAAFMHVKNILLKAKRGKKCIWVCFFVIYFAFRVYYKHMILESLECYLYSAKGVSRGAQISENGWFLIIFRLQKAWVIELSSKVKISVMRWNFDEFLLDFYPRINSRLTFLYLFATTLLCQVYSEHRLNTSWKLFTKMICSMFAWSSHRRQKRQISNELLCCFSHNKLSNSFQSHDGNVTEGKPEQTAGALPSVVGSCARGHEPEEKDGAQKQQQAAQWRRKR